MAAMRPVVAMLPLVSVPPVVAMPAPPPTRRSRLFSCTVVLLVIIPLTVEISSLLDPRAAFASPRAVTPCRLPGSLRAGPPRIRVLTARAAKEIAPEDDVDEEDFDEEDSDEEDLEATPLTGRERSALSSLAARRKAARTMPTVMADDPDMDAQSMLGILNQYLEQHELVLVRTEEVDKKDAIVMGEKLAELMRAKLVRTLGKTVLLYRPSKAGLIDLKELSLTRGRGLA